MATILLFSLLLGCGANQDDTTRPPLATAEANTIALNAEPPSLSTTVYITKTGSKYHVKSCSYLSKSCIPITLDAAKQQYEPCSKCCPPA